MKYILLHCSSRFFSHENLRNTPEQPPQPHKTADIVFRNGNIYTVDKQFKKTSSLAKRIGNTTKVVDLQGKMIMPDLVDAHMHVVSGGEFLLKCNLNYQPLPIAGLLAHVQGCIDDEGAGDDVWLEVSGSITKPHLDQLATNRPVMLRSADYHTVLANSRALEISNINADTPGPANGVVERHPGSREPSGNIEAGKAALKLLREEGITTFQDAAANPTFNAIFNGIKTDDALSASVNLDYRIATPKTLGAVDGIAIKAFIDGVITYPTLTAAPDAPWAPNGTWIGEPYWEPAFLEQLFLAGTDVRLHTDGDLAVKVALDAAAAFEQKHSKKKFKFGLACDEVTLASDWACFAQLGVDAIMSYQWTQLSSFYIPNTFKTLADYRLDNLQAYPQIENAGRPIVYGSDWPIDPLDEFLALKVAVTRSGDPENPNSPASFELPFDGPFPGVGEIDLTREQAIRSITINSAKFLRADDQIGSLQKGKLADLIILEKNFLEVPKGKLGRNRVLVTVVGGEPVFIAEDAGDFVQLDGLTAKFPNHEEDPLNKRLAARAIGGFAGKKLSAKGQKAAQLLRKRGECLHHKH
ncbi:amidohydrolase family-domain-containing protein [Immersiella caudata]|uniref:Amidohydrolase family-domain-containing protein n=1 Tax=Immersiella caudata TaxID=314043 RepID=A0AA40BTZ1_9PEZI|nr:amidohydrolase family-domain-containing protein [Immersiella caudata]